MRSRRCRRSITLTESPFVTRLRKLAARTFSGLIDAVKEALLAVTDREHSFIISGTGDIIEPDDGILAIGSGGSYALAAARALIENTDFSARDIVQKGLEIAAEICVYTNANITVLEAS